jgi:hypothetical protein
MNETQVCSAVAMKDGHGVRQTLVNIARNFAVRTALASFSVETQKTTAAAFPWTTSYVRCLGVQQRLCLS